MGNANKCFIRESRLSDSCFALHDEDRIGRIPSEIDMGAQRDLDVVPVGDPNVVRSQIPD